MQKINFKLMLILEIQFTYHSESPLGSLGVPDQVQIE